MQLFQTKEEIRKTGKVFCEDCQSFEPGSTPSGLGFCALTKNRQMRVEETGKTVPRPPGLAARHQPGTWLCGVLFYGTQNVRQISGKAGRRRVIRYEHGLEWFCPLFD